MTATKEAFIVFYDAENTYYVEAGSFDEAVAEAEAVCGTGWKYVERAERVEVED